jgi:hypothetical protein
MLTCRRSLLAAAFLSTLQVFIAVGLKEMVGSRLLSLQFDTCLSLTTMRRRSGFFSKFFGTR